METVRNEIGQLVITEYSSAPVVAHFAAAAKAGLWPSEQELIRQYFRMGRILDLGCGVGRVTIPLSRAGFDVVGVDIIPAMIEAARAFASQENLHVRYEVGDAQHLRSPDNSFEQVIFSNQGLMQIPGKEGRLQTLREIHRVLADDGLFLFSTHARPFAALDPKWAIRWLRWYGRAALGMERRGIDFGDLFYVRKLGIERSAEQPMEQYLHIPSPIHIQNLLQMCGFQILRTVREQTIKHRPIVWLAKKIARPATESV